MLAEHAVPPRLNCYFRVDLGGGKASREIGFCEVVFPEFAVTSVAHGFESVAFDAGASPDSRLLLRRGVTGDLTLYQWWDKARGGRAPKQRVVRVQLMNEDQSEAVLTWVFRNARPVSLGYSALNALQGEVQLETLALLFDRVDVQSG